LIFWGYNIFIAYEFDPEKNAINVEKHGLPLTAIEFFDWDTAQIEEDTRFDYAERRFQATGYIGARLYFMVFCIRDERTRVISLRKANKREERHYAQAKA